MFAGYSDLIMCLLNLEILPKLHIHVSTAPLKRLTEFCSFEGNTTSIHMHFIQYVS